MFYLHSIAPLLEAVQAPRCGAGRSLRSTPAPGARGTGPLVLVQAAARCPRSRLPRWSEAVRQQTRGSPGQGSGCCLAGGSRTQAATPSRSRRGTRARTSPGSTRLTSYVPKNESYHFLLCLPWLAPHRPTFGTNALTRCTKTPLTNSALSSTLCLVVRLPSRHSTQNCI